MIDSTKKLSSDALPLSYPWKEPPPPGSWFEVADDVYWLRMPLPFALDHINLYLLKDSDGWFIVDTGLGNVETRNVWLSVFDNLFRSLPVKAVICTHFHYDHTGSLGWLTDKFQCPVYMSRQEFYALFVGLQSGWQFQRFYERAGVSSERVSGFLGVINGSAFDRSIPSSYVRLKSEDVIKIGGRSWEVVIGSGHSPEHVCMLCRDEGMLLSGDQILPRISSSICVTPTEPEANPLADWFYSLNHLRDLPDDLLILPAHELPFYGLHQRLDGLIGHHERKIDDLLGFLTSEHSVDSLTDKIFPNAVSTFDRMLATGETLAHLNYLYGIKKVEKRLDLDERLMWFKC